ncbi:hypothetical protein ACIBO1_12520 [Micromonospora sp. NPDC049903]|uniref:hypothetical protein n=1 Tax=Micromonospora sp. NPDC049903 TaxID=3364276 RepID=UPI00379847DC
MAKKMLGKVVAGAALGGASLLVFAPGVALADGHAPEDEGKVFAKPHAVKPGDEVKLVQICEEAQEHPFVWSKVTGKVELESAHKDGDQGDKGGDRDWKQDRKDWEDRKDSQHDKDWQDEKDSQDGKDWQSGGEDRSGGKDWSGETESAPESKGTGGGAADAADESGKDRDWKAEEHGQDAEGARDHKAPSAEEERDAKSEKDWSSKNEHESSGEKDWSSEGEREWERSSEHGKDSDEHGKDDSGDRWEHEKDFVYYGEARVAKDAKPGTYELKGSCGVGELVVLPRGGVDGGDGGIATGTNGGLATAGAGMVGAAALGGLVLMRRRRTDEFAA